MVAVKNKLFFEIIDDLAEFRAIFRGAMLKL